MDSVESSQKTRGKTLEAENVALLKHLLEIELRRLKEEAELDMIFFVGVDGRIFASYIPEVLDASQFGLLSLWKAQLPHICAQLRNENMKVSIQQFKHGTVIITGVGDNAFLVSLISREIEVTNLLECMKRVLMGV
jgi:predicted regulator of Ras-like GTPase activity (Roadblock/LC7/MglB family)